MNKTSKSISAIEFVNLALAIFSWLFSDIHFTLKMMITVVLVSIIALSKFQPTSWLGQLSINPIAVLFGVPIIASLAGFYFASLCYSPDLLSMFLENRPLPLSLIYSLLVGLPLAVIGAVLYKRGILSVSLGLVSSIVWFYSIFGLLNFNKDIDIWKVSVMGPLIYAMVGDQCVSSPLSSNSLTEFLAVIVSVVFIPIMFYWFGSIWRSKTI